MASGGAAQTSQKVAAEMASSSSPWWHRLRWVKTNHTQGLAAERALLALGGSAESRTAAVITQVDVQVGPGQQQYMHTLQAKAITATTSTAAAAAGGIIISSSPKPSDADSGDTMLTAAGSYANSSAANSSGQVPSSSSPSSSSSAPPALVLVPGYGAGVGFFFRNLATMAGQRFRELYAVDLLGTGLSGRPPFPATTRQQAEDFFTDSLEAWRQAVGVERMVLCAHSLGGYLAFCYALKHPDRVAHLVLVCPAGVGARPEEWREPAFVRDNPWSWRTAVYRCAELGWKAGMTPGTLVRTLGPLGERMVRGYSQRRFSNFTDQELQAFQPYLYSILGARGSGEHALRHLLQPFAWPHLPIEQRLGQLKGVPLTFVYGEHDWMDPRTGQRVCEDLRRLRPPLNATDAQLYLVPGAGHYPFLEAPGDFHDALLDACSPHLPGRTATLQGMTPGRHAAHPAREEELPKKPDEPPTAESVATDL